MTNNLEVSDKEFEELKKVFYSQAYEIAEDLQDSVLSLETNTGDKEILKAIKRHVHTLKGDSNSFGLTSVGTLCHRMEDILSSIMDESGNVEHETVDLLLSCVETINRILIESESGVNGTDMKEIIERIDGFLRQEADDPEGNLPRIPPHIPLEKGDRWDITEYQELQIKDALKNGLNIYEVSIVFHPMCQEKDVAGYMITNKLNGIGHIIHSIPNIESSDIDKENRITFLFSTSHKKEEIQKNAFIAGITGEMNVAPYNSTFRHAEPCPESSSGSTISESNNVSSCETLNQVQCGNKKVFQQPARNEMLRVEASKVDTIMNLVGELIIGHSMIDQIAREVENGAITEDISSKLYTANYFMERTVSDLQMGIMKMRMVPIFHVFRKFPKIVRELSTERCKKVRLEIAGKETELDKGIVDAIGEPLSHLIRNSIDHGIEEPSYRRSIGKPEEGVITLKAYHEAGQTVMELSDDGRGIDAGKLKEKAIESGYIDQNDAERLSDVQAINLIFLSGLSTSDVVSETSGRGIGMDAVKSAVTSMRGSIEVESIPEKGIMFKLRIPLTLAVIKALLFEVGERLYAVPISVISEVTRIITDELITVDGRDTLVLRDRIISIIHLQGLFKINGRGDKKKYTLILSIGEKKVGILVDRLIGQQEIVIKAINTDYSQSDFVAGASILGNGKIVLILDVHALFRKAIEEEKGRMVKL